MKKLVFIYSIPKISELGLSDWKTPSGDNIKKTKIGLTKEYINASYSLKLGGLANYISYTPWVENGVQKLDDRGNKLFLQDKYEQEYNKPKGYYTNQSLKRGQLRDENDLTYFQAKEWTLNDGATCLDLSKEDDLMFYFVCLASHKVANSEKDYKSHKFPEAKWYIALENESDELKYSKTSIKTKAFAALEDSAMTPSVLKKFCNCLSLANIKTTLSNEQLHNLIFEYIDKTTFDVNSNVDKFTSLYKLLKDAKGKEEFEARNIAAQALGLRVIHEKQGTYTFATTKNVIEIGNNFETLISFILNDKKFDIVKEILDSIEVRLHN